MKIPDYINEKGNSIRLVTFTALFALIFINIYKPFSSSGWYPVSEFMFFVYSSLIILTGVLVVIISRIIMHFYGKRHSITYAKYAVWVFLEVLFMSLFYTGYTIYLNKERDAIDVFESSFINTALVLLLPYTVLWFYFGWKESSARLESLVSSMDELPQKAFGNIGFKDEKDVLRISINSKDLLYLESSDNYVTIYYQSNDKLKKFLLRNRIKNLEQELKESNVVRCHRSYMVNLERVKVLRREKDGLYIEMDSNLVSNILVSKSYSKKISEKFLSRP
ncbi:MAG: LytTR family DNA-binding domain-containing protein [Bacteroidales bacterium]|jgi:DNA-binding LytR/AlgR family response regulator|nr:LytTR family DNA-binding domain-containing protein [Bacteroidales bacterium]MDD3299563.1 LytTR family DNA-binding domain-containing protein [Bacteroidales bacterium]MDD3843903.1 LytTR family DNA-binding domain-containing protein [Bacteroidales bacterium]MDD4618171.1 LytTR family DNA-binding domain-containing protein [Bacteroidales bacterium]